MLVFRIQYREGRSETCTPPDCPIIVLSHPGRRPAGAAHCAIRSWDSRVLVDAENRILVNQRQARRVVKIQVVGLESLQGDAEREPRRRVSMNDDVLYLV